MESPRMRQCYLLNFASWSVIITHQGNLLEEWRFEEKLSKTSKQYIFSSSWARGRFVSKQNPGSAISQQHRLHHVVGFVGPKNRAHILHTISSQHSFLSFLNFSLSPMVSVLRSCDSVLRSSIVVRLSFCSNSRKLIIYQGSLPCSSSSSSTYS